LFSGESALRVPQLAGYDGVEARALNQAVKRNLARFPEDFMFQLIAAEAEQVRRLGRRY
jgi:hypothetical protein